MRSLLEFVTEAVSKGGQKKYADVLFSQSEFKDALERSKNTVPMAPTTFNRVQELMMRNAYPQMRSVVSSTSRPQYYVTKEAIYITNITFIYIFQYYEDRLLGCSRKPLDGTYTFNDIYLNNYDFRSSRKSSQEHAKMILREVRRMLTGEEISEAVTSKKKRYLPEFGCSIQEIVDWLEEQGLDGVDWSKNTKGYPTCDPGEVKYIIGACIPGNKRSFWVMVCNHYNQRVVLKPDIEESFMASDGDEKLMPFDQAVEKALEMIQKPNQKLKV